MRGSRAYGAMADDGSTRSSETAETSGWLLIGFIAVFVVVVWQVSRGVTVQKVGVPGIFEVSFASEGDGGTPPSGAGSTPPPADPVAPTEAPRVSPQQTPSQTPTGASEEAYQHCVQNAGYGAIFCDRLTEEDVASEATREYVQCVNGGGDSSDCIHGIDRRLRSP